MPKQTLIFVVLPNGMAPQKTLKASVYMAPRLDGGTTLAAFPDILNWAKRIKEHGLKFEFTCGAKSATVAANQQILRPDVWQEIFKPSTFVEAFKFPDFDKRLIVSYPTRDALSYLKYTYQTVATANLNGGGDGQRGLYELLGDLVFRKGKDSLLDDALANARVALWRQQQPSTYTGGGGIQVKSVQIGASALDGVPTTLTPPADARDTITRFALFHHMPPAPHRKPLPSTPADFAKTLDFHKALTALNSYPSLLRALGLVFDVELPEDFSAASPAGGAYGTIVLRTVTAGLPWSIKPKLSFPATAYFRDKSSFRAAPLTDPADLANKNYQAGDVVGGLLSLAPQSFNLVEVDLDGALLQALAFADNVANVFENFPVAYQTAIDNAMPALRSSGISLMASDRGVQLLASILNNRSFDDALGSNQPYPRPFFATDLTRGYRIDIWDSKTSQWHSLHHRAAKFVFGDGGKLAISVADEEGFLQTAAAQPADDPTRKPDPVATASGIPQPGTDVFIHERVARWDGWSLSVMRPGLALNRSPDPGRATEADPTANQPITPFKMVATFKPVPGTLPELRFGRSYRLRARAVDLAGNSNAADSVATDIGFALPASGGQLPYQRFEPVGPPVVVLQQITQAGAGLEQLVIRSYNSTPALDSIPTAQTDARHIAPPRTSERMAERHGMFDDANGKLRADAATYQLITTRDSYELPVSGKNGPPLVSSAKLQVGYLPDPLARGAAFRNLPNTVDDVNGVIAGNKLTYAPIPDVQKRPGSVTFIDFGSEWPGRLAFRLLISEGIGAPVWDAANRVLTVSLAKGSTASVPLSCYVTPKDLEILGVWGWLRELFEAQELAAMQSGGASVSFTYTSDLVALITRLVLEGGHEMLTPVRTLTLVHAVQQPLGEPTFVQLPVVHQPNAPIYASGLRNSFTPITAWRAPGSHSAVLLGGLSINGLTTAKIDLLAQLLEVTDDPSKAAPASSWTSAHVETIPITTTVAGAIITDPVSNREVAVYVPHTDMLWFAAPFDVLDGVATPSDIAAPVHRFDDTIHRWVSYQALATSRYQEYFPETNLNFTRSGPTLIVDVPSSARPLPPEIAYVVPTFGWEKQETTSIKSSVRFGNGLRVYLQRPWYSSGDNELLGVVLWSGTASPPNYATREQYKPLFTQWGDDPIWQSWGLEAVPTVYDFPDATTTATQLTIDETASQAFDVAAHAVQFDGARKLWYCDIQLNTESSYKPFVRLALARYQAHSIQGVELSRVVLADFAQLTADRSAVVSIDPSNPSTARVFVGGLAPQGPTQNTITVTVQMRMENVQSDLGWEDAPLKIVAVTEDAPAPSEPNAVLWSGSIVFAKKPVPGQFRVVIRETESLPVDPPQLTIIKVPIGTISAVPEDARTYFGDRLVYAAILPYDY